MKNLPIKSLKKEHSNCALKFKLDTGLAQKQSSLSYLGLWDFMLKVCERTKCFAAPLWTNCLQTSNPLAKALMIAMIVTVEGFGNWFLWRPAEEQRWSYSHHLGPRLKPLSGMQSVCHLQASMPLFDIQTNTCQRSMSHLAGLLETAKNLNFFPTPEAGGSGVLKKKIFQPSVHMLNTDFFWRPWRTDSTFHWNVKEQYTL